MAVYLSIFTHYLRVLASGTVVAVATATGKVSYPPADQVMACTYLVRVPSGNPEPDSENDCWLILPCGEPALVIKDEGWECIHGHRHLTYGSPAQIAEERIEAFHEYSQSIFR